MDWVNYINTTIDWLDLKTNWPIETTINLCWSWFFHLLDDPLLVTHFHFWFVGPSHVSWPNCVWAIYWVHHETINRVPCLWSAVCVAIVWEKRAAVIGDFVEPLLPFFLLPLWLIASTILDPSWVNTREQTQWEVWFGWAFSNRWCLIRFCNGIEPHCTIQSPWWIISATGKV